VIISNFENRNSIFLFDKEYAETHNYFYFRL